MNTHDTVYLFLMHDERGLPHVFHSFAEEKSLIRLDARSAILGRYGRDPEPESLSIVRNELYSHVDREVREWMTERRFFPRFLAALTAFFISYFFLSFVVRDPIPLVDELLVSAFAALGIYFFVERKNLVSKPALEQKILLKRRIDAVSFSSSKLIRHMESFLIRARSEGRGNNGDQGSDSLTLELGTLARDFQTNEYRQELQELKELIAIPRGRAKRFRKMIRKGHGTGWIWGKAGFREDLFILALLLGEPDPVGSAQIR